jgi:hypothetical protein
VTACSLVFYCSRLCECVGFHEGVHCFLLTHYLDSGLAR